MDYTYIFYSILNMLLFCLLLLSVIIFFSVVPLLLQNSIQKMSNDKITVSKYASNT